VEKKLKEMRLKAEVLDCSDCVSDMEKILRDTDGIIDASVNFKEDTIYVRYDPGVLDRKQVFSSVRRLGYKVKIADKK
jgi:Cu2+-exporting ATPase